ncbi:chemotaxis protein CheW [Candidatus Riflebacteria bacterium]
MENNNTVQLEKKMNGKKVSGEETIRISVSILDKLMNQASELVLVRNQNLLYLDKNDSNSRNLAQRLDLITTELQKTIMCTRMQSIGNVFSRFPGLVTELGKKFDKQISIEISGNEVELDKTILEALVEPLTHIIHNCCEHGIEKPEDRTSKKKDSRGLIRVSAFHEEGQIHLKIEDDGQGMTPSVLKEKALEKGLKSKAELDSMNDKELLNLVLLPGFSTPGGANAGLDVVRASIEQIGGLLDLHSQPDKGSTIRLRLPLTLAIIPSLIVSIGKDRFAIPEVNLEELVCLYDDEVRTRIETAAGKEVFRLRDQLIPMIRLSEVFKMSKPFNDDRWAEISLSYHSEQAGRYKEFLERKKKEPHLNLRQALNFAVIKVGVNRFGLIVDEIIGTEEIVVKPMHHLVGALTCYSGATIMGDGGVALILDLQGVAKFAGINWDNLKDEEMETTIENTQLDSQSVLLFKSGASEQFAIPLALIRYIKKVSPSVIEKVGDKEFITIDGVSTLIVRVDHFLDVSPMEEREELFLLMPKNLRRPFGLLVSKILDIEDCPMQLNSSSYRDDAIFGSTILKEKMTLIVDIYSLIEKVDPDWFLERRDDRRPPGEGFNLLLVEDNDFYRRLAEGFFKADGYRVVTAVNGKDAMGKLAENEFNLVVSDLEMPVMDGWSLAREIRSSKQYRQLPIIALTSSDSDSKRRRASEMGFDEFILKNERNQLLDKTQGLLRKR